MFFIMLMIQLLVLYTMVANGGAKPCKRNTEEPRRAEGGYSYHDEVVCNAAMKIVRDECSTFLGDLLHNDGDTNRDALENCLDVLEARCEEAALSTDYMHQCTFYVMMARFLDEDLVGSVWLNSFGDVLDQYKGCGKIVNFVNAAMVTMDDVQLVDVEEGDEEYQIFQTTNENSMLRRLVTGSLVAGLGGVLAQVCRSFEQVP